MKKYRPAYQEWFPLVIEGRPYGYIALCGDDANPAIGGCRILHQPYDETFARALSMGLAETMQKKSKAAGLPLSGGKTVIFMEHPDEKEKLLQHYASAMNTLHGRYITAVDIGSTQDDMDFLYRFTPHVTCHTAVGGDPSAYTAQTVLQGIETVYDLLPFLPQHRVVIQGLGKVGMEILERLSALSKYAQAEIIVTDIDPHKMALAQQMYTCQAVPAHDIYRIPCDLFISAANSHLVDETIASTIRCALLAVAGNNVFTSPACENILRSRGILVLPDYLINSGGVMYCALQATKINDLQGPFSANRVAVSQYVASIVHDASWRYFHDAPIAAPPALHVPATLQASCNADNPKVRVEKNRAL